MPRLDGAIAKAAEAGTKLALLFIDLDGFKAINDQLGHATGDAVLRVVGKRLVSCVREHDLVARIGGDEFVVVLTIDADLDEGVLRVADSIITAIQDPIRDPDIGQMLSGSIGIAFFPVDGATADALLTAADRRLYEAKRQGHGSISLAQC
jgi:diguanylate cyclase (GGDEF)-like protein